jgi:hypothetical protein
MGCGRNRKLKKKKTVCGMFGMLFKDGRSKVGWRPYRVKEVRFDPVN